MDLSNFDIPSSPELTCHGCGLGSKSQCPLAALKGLPEPMRLAWGKTNTRKVTCRRTAKRVKIIRHTGAAEWWISEQFGRLVLVLNLKLRA